MPASTGERAGTGVRGSGGRATITVDVAGTGRQACTPERRERMTPGRKRLNPHDGDMIRTCISTQLGKATIYVEGRSGGHTSDELAAALEGLQSTPVAKVSIDLVEAGELDQASMKIIEAQAERSQAKNQQLTVVLTSALLAPLAAMLEDRVAFTLVQA